MGFGQDEEWVEDYVEVTYDRTNYSLWIAKDGKEYPVSDMEDRHIKNVLMMIKRKRFKQQWLDEYGDTWKRVLENELKRRELT